MPMAQHKCPLSQAPTNVRKFTELPLLFYFCNTGNSLKENVPYEKNPLVEGAYNINSSCETFTFSEVFEEEVIQASYSFKTSFGSGIDNISSFLIKTAAPIIDKHLAYI